MTSFDRLRLLKNGGFHDNPDFKRWWIQLKRCYPWPDYVLAELLWTDLRQIWRIRNKRARANRRMMVLIGYLIAWRIGAVRTGRDLLEVRKLMAMGDLEKMVDAFLAAEAKAEAKEATRYARSRGEL